MKAVIEPQSICLVRLSALGDVTHVLPVLHALKQRYPRAQISWLIGKLEAKLLKSVPGVEWIIVDRKQPWSEWRRLRREFAGRRFDVLLQMQLALRAGFIASALRAKRRIGYPRFMHKELHGCFVRETAPPPQGSHVVDVLLAFARALDCEVSEPVWDLPVPEEAHGLRLREIGERAYALISPCSSFEARNWLPERYARVAEALSQRGLLPVVVGGRSDSERAMAQAIGNASASPVLDLVGKDTLPELLALIQRARVLISPDSGPIHFANALGTPALGLYAATDATRSGPYHDRAFAINRYADAARVFLGLEPAQLAWGKKIHRDGVMALIEVQEVIAALDRLLRDRTSTVMT
jgi:heptosyltransferase I